ncbi:hypothetical protein QJS10_CPA05g00789 [Acorus calamus]|uniref:Uncharacterized protein n=1 Tax=Acorus calamus TaxID=4465 RepID=A0AAV9ESB4_ACOCL|nr:hypothetical protein QJS10_CPA05g00789 [Acorus calamus]
MPEQLHRHGFRRQPPVLPRPPHRLRNAPRPRLRNLRLDLDLTLTDFRSLFGESPSPDRLSISASHASLPNKKVLVVFCGKEVLKLKSVQAIYQEVLNEGLNELVLVMQGRITAQARQHLSDNFPFKVQTFQITDLLVNITKHVLKPKHEILTPEEKHKLLKKYNLEEKQLPRMLETDAVARYYGLGRGQVVKVTYSSDVTESHVTYRCVM